MFIFRWPSFLYETPDDTSAPSAEPTRDDAGRFTPAAGDAPWASDLAALVPDEQVRGAVDGYLRENWQPRMTKLEQDYASTEDARELYTYLHDEENSVAAYLAMTEELYGTDVATSVASTLGLAPDTEETPVTEPPAEPEVPAHIQEMYDKYQADEAEKLYTAEIARVREAIGEDFDEDLFHPLVVTAQGDFEKAVEMYGPKVEQLKQRYAPAPADPEPAPTVLTDGGAAPTAVEPKYASINDAIDDMFSGTQPAPTTVGSV